MTYNYQPTEAELVAAHQHGRATAARHRPAYSGNPPQLAKDLYPLDVKEREAFLAGYLCEIKRLETRGDAYALAIAHLTTRT